LKLNSYRTVLGRYHLPKLPAGPSGPGALADLFLHVRRSALSDLNGDGAEWMAPISDDGVRKLIDLAFYASLLSEEGRLPRFKLVCQNVEGPLILVSRFDPISLGHVDQLRRLAPACTRPECALLVAERGGNLWCDGAINVGGVGHAIVPGDPSVGAGLAPELRVEVFGPGHLRAGESLVPAYELRAGCIRTASSYNASPGADRLRNAVLERVRREVTAAKGDRYAAALQDVRPFLLVLSKMLRTALDERHGGAFVFLPCAPCDPAAYGVKLLYHTGDLDLGADLVRYWLACVEAGEKRGTGDHEGAARAADARRAQLLMNAESVGNFSCVDGCVVLDRELKVCGFGAKIEVPPGEAERGPRRFKHIASGEIYDDGEFMRAIGGTRHQSAARLCQAHPGVLVYTVSQDGELKLFFSDAAHAYVFGPLDLPTVESELHVL
jgi:hypothetical protein